MNYYEILEVSPNASAEVIRAAYKSLIQRYHPDKNPNDAKVAERASLVVQAYEVLSDSDRRSAYDLDLKYSSAIRSKRSRDSVQVRETFKSAVGKETKKGNRSFWFQFLLVVVIIMSGWLITSLLKKRLFAEQELVQVRPAPESGRLTATTRYSASREVLTLLTDIDVRLKNPENKTEDTDRVLFIPVLDVRVGSLDGDNALLHLKNTRSVIRQMLQKNLAELRYEDLIKVDGEQLLLKTILDALREPADTGESLRGSQSSTEARGQYGVVEVLMPKSFSVK